MDNKLKQTLIYNSILIIFYSLIFICIFGYLNFDIHYTDWIFIPHKYADETDIPCNWLNFYVFLNENAPLPYYQDFVYPFKSSLLYIDYLPVFSIFLKIFFKYIIKSNEIISLQYTWWYGLLAWILQGLISYKIIKDLTKTTRLNAFICSIFFVIAPPMVAKFPCHFTLASHFLILLTLFPFLYKYSKLQSVLFFFITGILSCGIMPYFIPYCFIGVSAYSVYKFLKKEDAIFNLSLIPVYLSGIFITYIILAGFNTDTISFGTGYPSFSANLNTFVNPVNVYNLFSSRLFPFLNHLKLYITNQNEGFAYLGGGFILLALFSFIYIFTKYKPKEIFEYIKKYKFEAATALSVFIIMFILAITLSITLSDKLILDIKLPAKIVKLLSIFRTAGRFIWENYYIIYIFVFSVILKNFGAKKAAVILLTGLILQFYDIGSAFFKLNREYQKKYTYENWLDNNKEWNILNKKRNKIIAFDYYPYKFFDFANYAVMHNMKMNNMQTSRDIDYFLYYEYLAYRYANPAEDELYVFMPEDLLFIANKTKLKNCYNVKNTYIICVKDEEQKLKKIEFSKQGAMPPIDIFLNTSKAYKFFYGILFYLELFKKLK